MIILRLQVWFLTNLHYYLDKVGWRLRNWAWGEIGKRGWYLRQRLASIECINKAVRK